MNGGELGSCVADDEMKTKLFVKRRKGNDDR